MKLKWDLHSAKYELNEMIKMENKFMMFFYIFFFTNLNYMYQQIYNFNWGFNDDYMQAIYDDIRHSADLMCLWHCVHSLKFIYSYCFNFFNLNFNWLKWIDPFCEHIGLKWIRIYPWKIRNWNWAVELYHTFTFRQCFSMSVLHFTLPLTAVPGR